MSLLAATTRGARLGGSVPAKSEERAHLQTRLAFFGLSVGLACLFVWGMRLIVHPRVANHLLLAPVGALLGTWLYCRRGPCSWAALSRLDAVLAPLVGVSLAAFAAAGIADAPAVRTAASAAVLAIAGFLVPFMFIYGPPLLLEGPVVEIAWVTVTATAGVTALAAAAMGFGRRHLVPWERLVLGAGALCLVFPGLTTDGAGFLALAVIFLRPGPTKAR